MLAAASDVSPSTPALSPIVEKFMVQSQFAARELNALLELPFRSKTLEPGSFVVREGDIAESCCALLSGSAIRHRIARDGGRQILAVQFKGDLLNTDAGLLQAADHNVQLLTHAEIALIPLRSISDLADKLPGIGQALRRGALIETSIAREWIVNVGRRSALKRVAHLLCELIVRQGADGHNDMTIEWPLTQVQIADAAGLTAVHVNRTVQRMRSLGLISTPKRALQILDWVALQKAGDFNRAYLHLPSADQLG